MLAINLQGSMLGVANYMGGSVKIFPLGSKGALEEDTSKLLVYEGSGSDKDRQEAPHAHSVVFSDSGRDVYVCDLGTDRVMQYSIEEASTSWQPKDPSFLPLPAGFGPRYGSGKVDGIMCTANWMSSLN